MATHFSKLPGEARGQRSLVGYSPRGHKRVGHNLGTKQQQQTTDKERIWKKQRCVYIKESCWLYT